MVNIHCEHLDIAKIADSGQCFRMNKLEDDTYYTIAMNKKLVIKPTEYGAQFFCTQQEYDDIWQYYFDMDKDYASYSAKIPNKDLFLTQAAQYSKGIRILRQDPWEMLVTFIISQRKNIPAIKKSVEMLCNTCKVSVDDGDNSRGYAFPNAHEVSKLTTEQLNACSLGYRTKYIKAAAQMVADGSLNLADIKAKSSDDLQTALLGVPGVGTKVANCVMLFGYYRADSFPRDVWINRVIDNVYDGDFNTNLYKGYEGIIQQYMFYFGRSDVCAQKFLK